LAETTKELDRVRPVKARKYMVLCQILSYIDVYLIPLEGVVDSWVSYRPAEVSWRPANDSS